MTTRRSFLAFTAAALVAPKVVPAESMYSLNALVAGIVRSIEHTHGEEMTSAIAWSKRYAGYSITVTQGGEFRAGSINCATGDFTFIEESKA